MSLPPFSSFSSYHTITKLLTRSPQQIQPTLLPNLGPISLRTTTFLSCPCTEHTHSKTPLYNNKYRCGRETIFSQISSRLTFWTPSFSHRFLHALPFTIIIPSLGSASSPTPTHLLHIIIPHPHPNIDNCSNPPLHSAQIPQNRSTYESGFVPFILSLCYPIPTFSRTRITCHHFNHQLHFSLRHSIDIIASRLCSRTIPWDYVFIWYLRQWSCVVVAASAPQQS